MKLKTFGLGVIIVIVVIAITWVINIVRFNDCDFEAPYECEIIHGIGVFPPAAPITMWFGTDPEVNSGDNVPPE